MGTSLHRLSLHIWTSIVCQFWKRRAPKNDGDPFNETSKNMDMRSISIKEHERMFANMVNQKRLAFHRVFMQKIMLTCGFWLFLGNL